MKPVMYILLDESLGLSPGKLVVQGGHAVVLSLHMTDSSMYKAWFFDTIPQRKVVLGYKNESELTRVINLLRRDGIKHKPVVDCGLTELDPDTMTGLAVEIVDQEEYGKLFKRLSLFRF